MLNLFNSLSGESQETHNIWNNAFYAQVNFVSSKLFWQVQLYKLYLAAGY